MRQGVERKARRQLLSPDAVTGHRLACLAIICEAGLFSSSVHRRASYMLNCFTKKGPGDKFLIIITAT